MRSDTMVTVSDELAEARTKIDAARDTLRAVDSPQVRDALARLDRMAAELERVEERLGVSAVK